ncbi:hypothetical protein LR48_Vigan03g167000 [Vigna angularis]|uniref:Uncharacterized protein n=1 Tax=Phaseolus angularis TaxID=3914 RepID=A0A0L9U632_PHAAN|nr:hypothetical protein LR48_Vigan03g167000 [Vigna angularis]
MTETEQFRPSGGGHDRDQVRYDRDQAVSTEHWKDVRNQAERQKGHSSNKCRIKHYGIPNGRYVWIPVIKLCFQKEKRAPWYSAFGIEALGQGTNPSRGIQSLGSSTKLLS